MMMLRCISDVKCESTRANPSKHVLILIVLALDDQSKRSQDICYIVEPPILKQ